MANNDYITTDCKLTVSKNTAKLDEEIFLYKNDRNIKLLIEIVDNKYRYKSDDLSNLLSKYKASYAQVKWYKNAEVKKEFPIQPTDDGKVVFIIEGELINEDTELGDYDLQLRLLNENQESIRSLPIIKGAVHILKPLFEDGDIATVNSAVADRSMLSLDGAPINTYNSDGTYNQTNWGNGDIISSAKLNKLEKVSKDNVDKVNKIPAKSIVEDGKIYLAKEDGTKLDSGTELPAGGTGTSYDDTEIKSDINTIKTDLGTEELTTTAKTVKGAVNEVAAQYKDIVNLFTTEQTDTEIILKYGDTTILTIPLNSLTPIEKAELLSSNLCFYEPTDVPNTWVTDDSGKVLDVDTEAFYDLFYDPYVGTNSDGYTVVKTELGKDQSNTYPIYEYEFKPKNYTRTILLSSGMHTYELPAHFGCGWLIKSIMEKHNSNLMLKYLYENVRIKIIPIINPWGWNQNPKTYGNSNGVNPNRNFDYNDENGNSVWEQFPVYSGTKGDSNYNEWNVKGSAPFSEAEARILRDWALKNKDIAEFWIDCHTGLGLGPWDNFIYYTSDSKLKTNIETALNRLEDRIWNTYHISPTKEVRVDSPGSIRLAWAQKVAGIPGMTVEQTASNTRWGTSINNESGDIANYCTTLLTYIMEFLVTKYDVKYTQNRTPYSVNSNANIDFTIGSITFATGVIDSSKKTRVYTDFIEIETGKNIYIDTNYEYFGVIGYDANKSYVNAVINNWIGTKPNSIFNNDSNIKYIRVICKIDDNTEITQNIIASHYVIVGTTKYTPSNIDGYTITNNLTDAVSSNSATIVAKNSSYTTTITANNNYKINTITVTMGGVDITSTVVSGNTINITSVTGNVVITVTTTVTTTVPFIQSGTIDTSGKEKDNPTRFRTDYIAINNKINNIETVATTLSKKTVSFTDGSESDSTNRAATDYIPLNNKAALSIQSSVFSDAIVRYYKYENGVYNFLGSEGSKWGDGFEITNSNATHCRILFRKNMSNDPINDLDLDTSNTVIKLHDKGKDMTLNLGTIYGYYGRFYNEDKAVIGSFDSTAFKTTLKKLPTGGITGNGTFRYSNPDWKYIRLIGMDATKDTVEIDINNLEGSIKIDGVTYNLTNN